MNLAAWLLAAAPTPDITLTPAGAAIMFGSIGAVLCLVVFCTYRVLTLPPTNADDMQGPLRIDTRDTEDAD